MEKVMSRRQADYAIRQMLMSGYGHYSRAAEHKMIIALLKGNIVEAENIGIKSLGLTRESMNEYPLAVQPLRSIKNGMICAVAVLCRYAADLGAEDERSYALSDYYINEIETRTDINNWEDILSDILRHYMELVRRGKDETYTLPVQRAIRLIHQRLYEPCRLQDIAKELKVHPSYLSTLFREETGVSITSYIREIKINEAKNLLQACEHTVSEIAEMLGYSSVSYFSKVFHQVCACSPRDYAAGERA